MSIIIITCVCVDSMVIHWVSRYIHRPTPTIGKTPWFRSRVILFVIPARARFPRADVARKCKCESHYFSVYTRNGPLCARGPHHKGIRASPPACLCARRVSEPERMRSRNEKRQSPMYTREREIEFAAKRYFLLLLFLLGTPGSLRSSTDTVRPRVVDLCESSLPRVILHAHAS